MADTSTTDKKTETKVNDSEVLAMDDDKPSEPTQPKTEQKSKPESKEDKPESKEDSKKQTETKEAEPKLKPSIIDELTDLSSSDDEDELICNTEDWDITFKLSQFLDNHFILQLLKHVKTQKQLLKDTSEESKEESKEEKTDKISLVTEKLIRLYASSEITKYEYELLSQTCMIDEQLSLFDSVLPKTDTREKTVEALGEYKQRILAKLSSLESECGPLIDLLGEEKTVNDLIREKSFTLEHVIAKGGAIDNIDNLFAYCRLRYEIGFYQHTDILLGYYRMLTPDLKKKNAALWGALSAQILQNKWDDAYRSIRDIREHIEDSSRTLNLVNKTGDGNEDGAEDSEDEWTKRAKEMLAERNNAEMSDGKDETKDDTKSETDQTAKEERVTSEMNSKNKEQTLAIAAIMRDRAWLLHWSLFVFFNKDVLLDELIALFLNNKYMNVIQTMCPHLLRYLTSAVLISPNIDKQSKLKYLTDVSKIIIEEQYTYKDPITEFVRLVIRSNDFRGASQMLGMAVDVIRNDFFLAYYADYFMQYARTTFLIKYCKLYNRISVANICGLLRMNASMSNDERQLWLINAIRSENINAKLDVVENVIYVHFDSTNPYQEMKDRAKSMQQRTRELYRDINHKVQRLREIEEGQN